VKTKRWIDTRPAAVLFVLGLVGPAAHAGPVQFIANGGFESGFAGWTRADQPGGTTLEEGSGGFLLQTGATSPMNGFPVVAPPEGSNAAMTDAGGPGSHVLYQDFLVPIDVGTASISFAVYVNNQAADFFNPETLDFSSEDNQQARVDLMLASADPFSVDPADVLLNLFQTRPGDPLVSGYTTISSDITALLASHAGETLRLRFAAVDNQLVLNFGVDNASLLAAVPEPSTLLGAALGGVLTLGVVLRRRDRVGGRG
jgi:hypothetical protein